jgi:hypothetical protein
LQLKKRRKIRGKFPDVFGKNFPEFPENFLPEFSEISLSFTFLKNKIRAVTRVSSPENPGKSGGKISRNFPGENFPTFSRIS